MHQWAWKSHFTIAEAIAVEYHDGDISFPYDPVFMLNIKSKIPQISVRPVIMITGDKERMTTCAEMKLPEMFEHFPPERRYPATGIFHPVVKKISEDDNLKPMILAVVDQTDDRLLQFPVFFFGVGTQVDI